MRHPFTAAAIAALAFSAASLGLAQRADAGTIEFTSDTGSYTGLYGGGEFGVTSFTSGPTLASMGSGVQVSGNVFQTFCLEVAEPMDFDTTLNFSTSTAADDGGTSGGTDPLSAQSAYLYTQFWNGTLSDYTYTTGSGRTSDATSLQLALWYLEGEVTGNSSLEDAYDDNTQAQAWVSAANTAVGNGTWSGLGGVLVLNVTDANGRLMQDVLVVGTSSNNVIPLPPAALLGFGLMTGVGGLGLLRRRTRRALV